MDIAEFLTARLDEDERGARAAAETFGADWTEIWTGIVDLTGNNANRKPANVSGWDTHLDTGDGRVSRHIVEHDPARVLAEIAAKRAIIAAHPPLPVYSEKEQHIYGLHPQYEYATTEGQRKMWDDADRPPEGDGWERNVDKGDGGWERFDYTEESYWRRRLPPERTRTQLLAPAVELRALAAIYADHPDYDPSWCVE